MNSAQKILFVWWYDRDDLLQPLLPIIETCNCTFIFHKYKREESSKLNILFWSDFESPYELLKKVNPSKVVFFGIESNYTIALNIACKKINVPTYHLEHGIRNSLSYYINIERKQNQSDQKAINYIQKNENFGEKTHSIRFLIKTFKFWNLSLWIKLIYFNIRIKKYGLAEAMLGIKFKERNADYYINYTKKNARYIVERDNVALSQFTYIGVPSLDVFFKEINCKEEIEPYFLLIDTPFLDIENYNLGVTHQMRDNYYARLAKYSKDNHRKLIVKLHPASYNAQLPQIENLEYRRECEIGEIIKHSEGVFGFFSTLIYPAIYLKPTLLFETPYGSDSQKELQKAGFTKVINIFDKESAIEFYNMSDDQSLMKGFEDLYLFKADGKSTQRLYHYLIKE